MGIIGAAYQNQGNVSVTNSACDVILLTCQMSARSHQLVQQSFFYHCHSTSSSSKS